MVQLFRYILFPVSVLYAVVVRIRNFLFDCGVFKSEVFSTPTIAIGNLTTGGTGKTPMVTYLIDLLGPEKKIAVLSRGYKRKSKGFVLSDGNSAVSELGDEPFQIARKYPRVRVAVDANRRNGIQELQKRIAPDLIILDDAYQHRWVKPSLSFLLTAYDSLYVNDWYLPTGNLRDSKYRSRSADMIIVTKCPKSITSMEKEIITRKLRPLGTQRLVFGTLEYESYFVGTKGKLLFDDINGKKVALVTGIANPEPLVKFLEAKGVVFEHLRFSDHHNFTQKEIRNLKTYEIVLTTEKDFVRMANELPNAYFLGVRHHFSSEDDKTILTTIRELFKSAPQPFS